METVINHNLRRREVGTTMEDEDTVSLSAPERSPIPWSERVLYLLLPYLHLKRQTRVLYLLTVVSFFSLTKAGGEVIPIEGLTGRRSFVNQVLIKMGLGWTLPCVILLRLCSLPLHSNWKEYLLNLLLRLSTITFFYYFWCQVIFPIVEEWTGRCVKNNIVVDITNLSKKQCRRLKGHEFFSVDISGHSFLLPYCIFIIMEESKELIYVLRLGQFLRRAARPTPDYEEEEDPESKDRAVSFRSPEERLFLERKFSFVVPPILLATIMAIGLSFVWDLSFLVTTLYYHSFIEKALGVSIAIGTWYVMYPILFTTLDIL